MASKRIQFVLLFLIIKKSILDKGIVNDVYENKKFSCNGVSKIALVAKSQMQCIHLCMRKSCKLLNYKTTEGGTENCEVFTGGSKCSNLVYKENWIAIDLQIFEDIGSKANIEDDYCRASPCKNNGVCRRKVDGYICECPTHFSCPNCIAKLKYIGCYIDATERAMPNVHSRVSSTLGCSIEQCIEHCKELNYTYAGVQLTDHCFCGNSYDKYGGANDTCSYPCNDGTNRKCGGVWRNSVYRAGLEYTGCYNDNGDRALTSFQTLNVSLGKLTEQCISKCSSLSYPYAGLQHYEQCYCGTTFDKHGKANESQCNTLCKDSSGRYCGGSWTNSVYKT